jgi:hypothetical protein
MPLCIWPSSIAISPPRPARLMTAIATSSLQEARAPVGDEALLVVWSGSTWSPAGGGESGGDGAFDTVGINATADTTNRLAVSSPASLFNHAGNGHQVKLNKAAADDTTSLLFQTDWSGRAEIGTTGDDDFHFKVSPDGSDWHDAILIDKDTGAAALPSGFVDPAATRAQLKIVTLAQAAYDALDPPDADTLYFITDAE